MCFNLTGGTKMMFLAGLRHQNIFKRLISILKKKPNGYYFLKI
ncbi:hypothetical protein [Helicobacter pylori]